MKLPNKTSLWLIIMLLAVMTSCDFVGDVLEFSFWTIFIFFGIIILLIVLIVKKLRG